MGLKQRDNVTSAVKNLHWLHVISRIKFKIALMMYYYYYVHTQNRFADLAFTMFQSSGTVAGFNQAPGSSEKIA